MATIRLVPSILYNAAGTSYLTVSNESSAFTDTDSETYATVSNIYASTTNRYVYLRGFNFDDVPNGAIINSFEIKLKARESGGSASSSYRPVICKGTSTYSNAYCDAITTTTATHTFSVTQDYATFADDGDDFGIRINCRRNSRNTAATFYIYGAEILVDYTIPISATITSTLTGNGTISPDGATTTYEGAEYTLTITPTDTSEEVTAKKNGVDITSELVAHGSGGTLTAATLSGSLAPAKLSAAVPISKGGTGATTAAAARTNLAVLPLAGGTVTGQVKSTYANPGGFLIEHGTASKDACFRATRTDTDVSVYMGVGSGGTNHGVYSYKLGKWIVYADGSNIYCNGTATNVTGTVALAHGGTGATTAAAARTNLGITCASLYNGSLSSGSITFNYGNYNAYLILGQPGSATAIAGIVVPKGMITTSDVKYQITDESYYRCFNLKYSGSTVTLTISTGSGTVNRVFGLT